MTEPTATCAHGCQPALPVERPFPWATTANVAGIVCGATFFAAMVAGALLGALGYRLAGALAMGMAAFAAVLGSAACLEIDRQRGKEGGRAPVDGV